MDELAKAGGVGLVAVVGVSTQSLVAVGIMLLIVIVCYFLIRSIWTKVVEPTTIGFCHEWAAEARKRKQERQTKAAAIDKKEDSATVRSTP